MSQNARVENLAAFSCEMRALLQLARSSAGPECLQTLASPVDWNWLAQLADKHHLVSLVYWNLNRFGSDLLSDGQMAKWREEAQGIARRNLYLVGQLLAILQRLEEQGIAAICFKGPMLAAGVYGNLALRCCGDLDLLMRQEDAMRAKELLLGMGFRPIFPFVGSAETKYLLAMDARQERKYFRCHWEYHLLREDLVNVDLHWRIMPPELALNFDQQSLWRRATTVRLGGCALPSLCNEDLLLVLCANGTKDLWVRLDRICDVAEVLGRTKLDWDYVLDSARRMGGLRLLLVGLALAHRLLEAPLPDEVRKLIEKDRAVEKLMGAICLRLAGETAEIGSVAKGEEVRFFLGVRERLRDRLRYCINYLGPTVGDWAMLRLPRPLSFLYYLLRPLRLLGKFASLHQRQSALR